MISSFTPPHAPVGGSLTWSALVAILPLLTIFLTLGLLKWKAHVAGLAALLVAILVAIFAFKMPVNLALLSATQGAAYGIFPIMWIVFCAIVLYQITVVSGRFDDLRATFGLVSDDPRIQAIIIAFSFGAMLEALAGFGAPVAITSVMLIAVGFAPLRAACIALLANTAPVAFGAVGIPIITAGTLTGINYNHIGAYVGHQTPILACIVPLMLVALADGIRGIKQTWPVALVVGVAFGVAQWASSTYFSVELTDVVASLVSLAVAVIMLRFWKPQGGAAAAADLTAARHRELGDAEVAEPAEELQAQSGPLTQGRIWMALFPYLLVIVVFGAAKLVTPLKTFLVGTNLKIHWPGLDGNILTKSGKPSTSTIYSWEWLSSPGTLLLICSIIIALVYQVSPSSWVHEFVTTLNKLKWAILTVASVLALAYVMNFSGETVAIGTWIAGTGTFFAFLSPILGWLGTAVTGSDTSANALFATLQQTAAKNAGINPTLLVAANSSGGVIGKMMSPQNLTIAATSVGLLGKESEILRKVILWSLALLLVMCILVGLQATVLSWMLP